MVEGELLQLAKIGRMDVTEDDALQLATYKTACLFSGCARLGAVLGGLEGADQLALSEYGRYAGLAFQLVDDLPDFTASAQQLGKPVLSDLKEGKVTAMQPKENTSAASASATHGGHEHSVQQDKDSCETEVKESLKRALERIDWRWRLN